MCASFTLRKTFAQFALAASALAAVTICSFAEDAEARPKLRYSGGSNSGARFTFDLDTSVLDADSNSNQGFFLNAVQNFSFGPGLQYSFDSADIKIRSFRGNIRVADLGTFTNAEFPTQPVIVPQTVYQLTFPRTETVAAGSYDTLAIFVRSTDISVDSLLPLEQITNEKIKVSDDFVAGRYSLKFFDSVACPPEPPACNGDGLTADIPVPEPVPEPITGTILGAGVLGGALMLKRRKTKQTVQKSEAEVV